MVLTLVATLRLGKKEKGGFAVMIAANVCWMICGSLNNSTGQFLANAVILFVNIRAMRNWQKSD